jgi:hypothetical protein
MNTRGGKREGAGRKPLPDEQVTRPRTIRLTDAEWQQVKDRGGAEYVRRIVREAIAKDTPPQ